MGGYLVSVAAVSVLCGACTLISYKGSEDKGAKIAFSILLLYISATPVVSFVTNVFDINYSDLIPDSSDVSIEDSALYEVAQSAFCDGIERLVCDKFSIDNDCVSVYAREFDIESMSAKKIIVILTGRAVTADARGIAAAVKDAGLGECEVELDFS